MSTIESTAFLDTGKMSVQVLRQSLADLLATVGADPSLPQEISRRFGLDKTLTWRIARVIREENAWESVSHIPRRPSMRIFLRAMERHGAPEANIQAVWSALEHFEEFVHTHTGDRETLEAMLGGAAKRSTSKRMEMFRKSAFQANSAIWGVRAKAQIGLSFMTPSRTPEMLDLATVTGLVDFRRLRPDVTWEVGSAEMWETSKDEPRRTLSGLFPLDVEGMLGEVPLLAPFCSQPLPEITVVNVNEAYRRFELNEGPVGNTAAATLMLGWNWRNTASIYQRSHDEVGEHGMHMSTPVEVAILDLMIHKSLAFAFDLDSRLFSRLPSGPRYMSGGPSDSGALPVSEEITDLGAGPPDMTTVEVPRYRELAEFAAGKIGYKLEDFHGFRFRLKYPPIPTTAVLRHPLLQKPENGK